MTETDDQRVLQGGGMNAEQHERLYDAWDALDKHAALVRFIRGELCDVSDSEPVPPDLQKALAGLLMGTEALTADLALAMEAAELGPWAPLRAFRKT